MKIFKKLSTIAIAFAVGVLVSLQWPVFAEKNSLEKKTGLPVSDLRTFAEVYKAVKEGYVEPVSDKKMIANAISGLLANLDPHSAYLNADAFKELQVGTQGEFGGLGIEVGMENGLVKVISPIEDTPAFRAGIKAGDLIFKLDGKPVKGLSLTEAVKHMRGKPSTSIRLSILRKGEGKPLEFTIVREVIRVKSVKSKMTHPDYAYLRIVQFQESTVNNLVKHLKLIDKKGIPKGLILDLRNDPGGLLYSAIGVASAFLPEDRLIVSTEGRVSDAQQKFHANPQAYARVTRRDILDGLPSWTKTVPMVVLINAGSASASEIVAGALQDHKRAPVMGVRSFGKGSVQTVIPLRGGAGIKLTTARYYTPSGRSIQAKGIDPDYVVSEKPEGGNRSDLAAVREADLQRHLENGLEDDERGLVPESAINVQEANVIEETEKCVCDDGKSGRKAKTPGRLEFASKDDYQFQQAMAFLQGKSIAQSRVKAEPEKETK